MTILSLLFPGFHVATIWISLGRQELFLGAETIIGEDGDGVSGVSGAGSPSNIS